MATPSAARKGAQGAVGGGGGQSRPRLGGVGSVHDLDVAEQLLLQLGGAVALRLEEVHVASAGGVAPAVALGEHPLAVVADDREQRARDRVRRSQWSSSLWPSAWSGTLASIRAASSRASWSPASLCQAWKF